MLYGSESLQLNYGDLIWRSIEIQSLNFSNYNLISDLQIKNMGGSSPSKVTLEETDQNAEFEVNFEYCSKWGYYGKFVKARDLLQKAYPKAKITGAAGRTSSFEITITNKKGEKKLVHSKLGGDGFLNESNINAFIKKNKSFVEI